MPSRHFQWNRFLIGIACWWLSWIFFLCTHWVEFLASEISWPEHKVFASLLHILFISVAQSCPTLPRHGLQHARPPCPSLTPGVYSDSCPLSQWCHPTILSSVVPFSSYLQSSPASGSFQMSLLFTSGGESIGVSVSTSVLPMNEHPGLIFFRMDWLDLLAVQGILSTP